MLENLKKIITELGKYRNENGLTYSDDMILDAATRLYISKNISQDKKQMTKEINDSKQFIPATDKQLAFISNNLGHVNDKISKEEASKIISEFKNKKGADY